jgi:cytochrome c
MATRVEKVTERFSVEHFFGEACQCVSCFFDGKKVLQAFQGFYPDSKPNWSVWGKYGYDHAISKEEFKERYNQFVAK